MLFSDDLTFVTNELFLIVHIVFHSLQQQSLKLNYKM